MQEKQEGTPRLAGGADALEAELREWRALPERLEELVEGASDADLARRCPEAGVTVREMVHHLLESNLVASNILLAALGTRGGTFDWSWVQPRGEWSKRLGYAGVDVLPAIELLRALGAYFALLLRAAPDAARAEVRLLDEPGAATYPRDVAGILRQENEHAREHLADARRARSASGP